MPCVHGLGPEPAHIYHGRWWGDSLTVWAAFHAGRHLESHTHVEFQACEGLLNPLSLQSDSLDGSLRAKVC